MNSAQVSQKIGLLIREHRVARGLSQKELATLLGYGSAQYISDWERGHSAIPLKKLAAISKCLSIPQDHLFELLLEYSRDRLTHEMKTEYQRLKVRRRA